MLLPLVAIVVCASLAIVGAERQIKWLHAAFKPLATALLLAVVGVPTTHLSLCVAAGILFSLVGDIALLDKRNGSFLIGLVAFAFAHVTYTLGFLHSAAFSPRVVAVAVAVAGVSAAVVRAVWRGAAGLRVPALVYTVVISVMVVAACAADNLGPAMTATAGLGAVFFYVSDILIALNRFRRPIAHAQPLILSLYWLGQLGIAVSARWSA